MKLFLDTAEIKEIEEAASTGLIDGITTNPSLVAKTGLKFKDLLLRICQLIDGPISAEVTALDSKGMIDQGRKLAALHKNIVVKVPLIEEGLKAAIGLHKLQIRTNITLCFTPLQAILAAKAGGTYVSPFIGRLDDIGQDGMALISDIKTIYRNYGFKTQILVASVRSVEHVLQSARMGGDVATIPFKIFSQLFKHPLTDSGLARFLKDWENAGK